MGAKQKVKQTKASRREKARRAEELKALFEQNEASRATSTQEPTSSYVTPTPTLTELTESQKAIRSDELTQTKSAFSSVSYEKPREATSLRTVVAAQPYSPARRLDQPAIAPATAAKRESEPNRGLGLALLGAAALIGFLGFWNVRYSQNQAALRQNPNQSKSSAVVKDERARVEFYRQQMGHRLNQQRVDVEVQNFIQAPSLAVGERAGENRSSVTSGLPLAPATIENTTGGYASRNRTTPLPPDHPDARVYYSLEEEQHRDEYTRQVNRDYVNEFVRNAEREGLKVRVDGDYNIIDVERDGRSLMRNPGSEQGPAR